MSRLLRSTIALAIVSVSIPAASASVATQQISFSGILLGDTNAQQEVAEISMSFVDSASGGTISYILGITLDWVDEAGNAVSGLTGVVFGASNLGANTILGINPQDTGAIEQVTLAGGGVAYERLTFNVSNVSSTAGPVDFIGFSNVAGNLSNAAIEGTTELTATAMRGPGFRLNGIDASFNTTPNTAVPEPGTWMMFGVIGVLLGARAHQQRKKR